jgi:hypothetical protein
MEKHINMFRSFMSTTVNTLLSFHRISIEDSDHRRKRPLNGIRVTRDHFSRSILQESYNKAIHVTRTVQTDRIHSDHFSWNTLLGSYTEADYICIKKTSTWFIN